MKKLKIYLADLVHIQQSNNYAVPLNIAYIATQVTERFGNNVITGLYKSPDHFIKALPDKPGVTADRRVEPAASFGSVLEEAIKEINSNEQCDNFILFIYLF